MNTYLLQFKNDLGSGTIHIKAESNSEAYFKFNKTYPESQILFISKL